MNNKEIRDILLGRIVRLEDKLWAAAPAGTTTSAPMTAFTGLMQEKTAHAMHF